MKPKYIVVIRPLMIGIEVKRYGVYAFDGRLSIEDINTGSLPFADAYRKDLMAVGEKSLYGHVSKTLRVGRGAQYQRAF